MSVARTNAGTANTGLEIPYIAGFNDFTQPTSPWTSLAFFKFDEVAIDDRCIINKGNSQTIGYMYRCDGSGPPTFMEWYHDNLLVGTGATVIEEGVWYCGGATSENATNGGIGYTLVCGSGRVIDRVTGIDFSGSGSWENDIVSAMDRGTSDPHNGSFAHWVHFSRVLTLNDIVEYCRSPWKVVDKYIADCVWHIPCRGQSPERDFSGNGNHATIQGTPGLAAGPPIHRELDFVVFPGGGGAQTVNAGLASATANALAPSGDGTGSATVSPALASAAAAALAPSGAGTGSVSVSPALASAGAAAHQPAGAGSGSAPVAAALASAAAAALAPSGAGSGSATVSPGIASAAAAALGPSGDGTGSATVAANLAVATAVALAASASLGSGPQTVDAGLASATSAAHQPTTTGTGTATVTAALASALAVALAPSGAGTGAVVVNAGLAIAIANAHAPTATADGLVVNANIASATAAAHQPTATGTGQATVIANVAAAVANAFIASGAGTGVVVVNAGLASAAAAAYSASAVQVLLEIEITEDLTIAQNILENIDVAQTIKESVTVA